MQDHHGCFQVLWQAPGSSDQPGLIVHRASGIQDHPGRSGWILQLWFHIYEGYLRVQCGPGCFPAPAVQGHGLKEIVRSLPNWLLTDRVCRVYRSRGQRLSGAVPAGNRMRHTGSRKCYVCSLFHPFTPIPVFLHQVTPP